jgi:hypothetical protein
LSEARFTPLLPSLVDQGGRTRRKEKKKSEKKDKKKKRKSVPMSFCPTLISGRLARIAKNLSEQGQGRE